MISVAQAQTLIAETVRARHKIELPLSEAAGMVLAESPVSAYPLPFFNNSAMDGYALLSGDTAAARTDAPVRLFVAGTVAAGEPGLGAGTPDVTSGVAVQIFTGAAIAHGADAVIRQEDVVVSGQYIEITRPVKSAENVRFQGEEIKPGDTLLPAGTPLSAAAIGLLASAGIDRLTVYAQPTVGIIVTGSEIVNNPADLVPGKILDSNSHCLSAALRLMELTVKFQRTVEDDLALLHSAVEDGLNQVDVLLITGGVSVGKYDYVKDVAAETGIHEVFWRIRQKPGKPLFFGATPDREKLVFGLPGNPASVLVCFYEYVCQALQQASGVQAPRLIHARGHLQKSYTKPAGLTHFLKGRIFPDDTVEILERQGSHMMSSFALANCLVVIPEDVTSVEKGTEVEVHLLPV